MGVGFGGQGGCERRVEVFVKIQKKIGGGVGSGGERSGWAGQGGCERRIEVFEKIHKKKTIGGSGVVGGVRVRGCSGWGGQGGCDRRIKVFVKIQKKWGVRGVGWGVGRRGSGGVRIGGGQGRCECNVVGRV